MPRRFLWVPSFAALGAALIALLGKSLGHPVLFYIFKPLTTVLILSIPLSIWLGRKSSYVAYVSAGLLLSAVGDSLLMLSRDYFLSGLIAFLLAHITYLLAFSERVPLPASPRVWQIYFAFAIIFYVFLYRALPPGLPIAVALYCISLISMAAQAMGRFTVFRDRFSLAAALGALLFLISDCILSIDRFRSAIPAAYLLVLVPYYLGQWLIACSTLGRERL